MKYSEEEIRQIKESTDLVEHARRLGLDLRQVGHRFRCSCPFHNEKTPSFYINPQEGFFYCFGCNKHGDIITLTQELKHLSFTKAIDHIKAERGAYQAARKVQPRDQPLRSLNSKLREHLDDIVLRYQDNLSTNKDARDYLTKRGISAATIERFQIGYAGTRPVRVRASMEPKLKAVGILNKHGREAFAGRVTMPIRDEEDQFTQLYGRRIKDGEFNHRYLQIPHRTLFNPKALKKNSIYLCESIIDSLTLHSKGIENSCGIYGTNSMKDDYIKKLSQADLKKVVIAYDNDPAGNKAAKELARRLREHKIRARRLRLPTGYDVNKYYTQKANQ